MFYKRVKRSNWSNEADTWITAGGMTAWARGYKTFFMLNSAEHEI